MSAPSNKKLTEKQLAEQKQNKEVKMYTIGFTVVMAVILVVAIAAGCMQFYSNSGIRERKTIAYTVGEHPLTSAEFGYFYTDSINNFLNQYGAYAAMFGLDTSKPLDQQVIDEEAGTTWADDFMNTAKETAKSVYTLSDEARAKGHTLNEEEKAAIDSAISSLDLYADMNGLGSGEKYLKAMYGNGSTLETYRAYLENSMLADSYRIAYSESLQYDDAALREHEKDHFDRYSSFTYNQYYLSADRFLADGEVDADGNVTFTDAQKAEAVKDAEEAAKALTSEKIATVADLDKAISALDINKDTGAASSLFEHKDYLSIPADTAQWLVEKGRKAGDTTYLTSTTSIPGEDGESTEEITGFTVLMFGERDDNKDLLPNVRHILVSYEGGEPSEMGQMIYSDEEKAAAMAKAEELLAKYESGEKTEEAFAALATENTTDPGSKANGGLYENVFRGQMVPAFNDWVFDASRKTGDTGIVETEYGCHVMYYCGDGSMSYRDSQIRSELVNADMDTWYHGLLDAAVASDGDTSLIRTDLVLSR